MLSKKEKLIGVVRDIRGIFDTINLESGIVQDSADVYSLAFANNIKNKATALIGILHAVDTYSKKTIDEISSLKTDNKQEGE